MTAINGKEIHISERAIKGNRHTYEGGMPWTHALKHEIYHIYNQTGIQTISDSNQNILNGLTAEILGEYLAERWAQNEEPIIDTTDKNFLNKIELLTQNQRVGNSNAFRQIIYQLSRCIARKEQLNLKQPWLIETVDILTKHLNTYDQNKPEASFERIENTLEYIWFTTWTK